MSLAEMCPKCEREGYHLADCPNAPGAVPADRLSLRDEVARSFMAALLSRSAWADTRTAEELIHGDPKLQMAVDAYEYADAFLGARAKEGKS